MTSGMHRDDYTVLECGKCGTSIGRSVPDGIWLKHPNTGESRFFRPDPDLPSSGEIPAYCPACKVSGMIDVAKVRRATGNKNRSMRVRLRRVET